MKKEKKKKVNIKKIIKLIISIIMLMLSLVCFKYVYDINILPNKYLYLFIGIILIINILSTLLLFIRGIISKIISGILYLILGIISIIGIKYAGNTIEYLNKGFSNNIEYTVYNIVISNDSNYQSLNDLENTNMGYLFIDIDDDRYLDLVKDKINIKLKELGVSELYNNLINKDIESIIVNEAYVDLLEQEFTDFSEKTKVIDTIKVEKKNENNNQEKIKELKSVNIYLSGSDSRNGVISSSTLSDVNMILTINPSTHTILLTSIPRDYYVQLHGTTGYKDKLTHAGIYGIDMSRQTIEDFMGIKIDYSVKVGFNSVIKLVDLVGGIDVYSDTAFSSHCKDGGAERVNVIVGMNHFNGAQALSYARERYAYSTGDIHRTQNQQQVIEAVLNKITTNKSLLLKYDSLLNSFSELYRTDVPKELITLLIKQQLEDMSRWAIEKQSLTGYDSSNLTYSMGNIYLYVMIPDQNSVENGRNKINEVYNSVITNEPDIKENDEDTNE